MNRISLLLGLLLSAALASAQGPVGPPPAPVVDPNTVAAGELLVEPVLDSDWPRIAELADRYEDLPLGIVDASVIALAERRQLDTIATLDQRHFATVKPRHTDAFTLVP